MRNKNYFSKFTIPQILLFGYVSFALLGAALLSMPISTASGNGQKFIDALFTASSAITTTGLGVVDTGSFYSRLGQFIILLWFQIGGLGYMTFIALFIYALRQKISLKSSQILDHSIAGEKGDLKNFVKLVIFSTLIIEFAGAAVLIPVFLERFSIADSIYYAVFHSVSAFCTAGFSTFADSFTFYADRLYVNFILIIISIIGSLGFFVLKDTLVSLTKTLKKIRPRFFHLHTNIVLSVTAILSLSGTAVIFLSPSRHNIIHSLFQAVSATTTTGFNTIDIGSMASSSLLFIIILMFIGAGPGGTGGGIKNSTFAVIFLDILRFFKTERDVQLFKRTVARKNIENAYITAAYSLLVCFSILFILTVTEKISFLSLVFEVVSAFGTVGLSMGATSHLTSTGRVLISVLMLFGRIGPTIVGFSFLEQKKPKAYRYAESEVYTG